MKLNISKKKKKKTLNECGVCEVRFELETRLLPSKKEAPRTCSHKELDTEEALWKILRLKFLRLERRGRKRTNL